MRRKTFYPVANLIAVLVFIWAFTGSAIKQAPTPLVATTAWVLSVLVAVVLAIGFLRRDRQLPPPTLPA